MSSGLNGGSAVTLKKNLASDIGASLVSFKSARANALKEAVEDVLDRTIHVDSFGADSSGDDDSSAHVNFALTAVPDGGSIRFAEGGTYKFNASCSKSVKIKAKGATVKPNASGYLLHLTGATSRVEVEVGLIDMTGFTSTAGQWGDVGVFGDGIASLKVRMTETKSGSFPLLGLNCGSFTVFDCDIDSAGQWGAYSSGCGKTVYSRNWVRNTVTFDGLKVAGATGSDALVDSGIVVVSNNILENNNVDGIDVAINGAKSVLVSNNIGYTNGDRLVDCKILDNTNGAIGIDQLVIIGNLATVDVSGSIMINVQDNLYNGNIKKLTIANNDGIVTVAANSATMIRVQDVDNANVKGNSGENFYYGVRLQGSDDSVVEQNSIIKTVRGVITETSSTSTLASNRARVRRNQIRPQDHNSGAGNAVSFDVGDANECYDNDFDASNSAYTVVYEANGGSCTNTKLGRNRRGWSDTVPTGNRAVPGEFWEVPLVGHGKPDAWVCNTLTSSTTTTQVRAYGQHSYRTAGAAPSVNAYFIGEEFLDTTNNRWYKAKATGSGSSDWVALN